MMKRILSAIVVGIFFLSSASAMEATTVVAVRVIPPAEPIKAGEPAKLTIELSIPGPYHINGNRPLQDYLIPTQLEFEPIPNVRFGPVNFPDAEIKKLPVSDSPMAVYEGTIKITAEIIPAAAIAKKQIVIRGRVRSQACDNRSCLPPVWQPFSLTIPVIAPVSPIALSRPGSQIPATQDSGQLPESSGISGQLPAKPPGPESDFGNKGILITFLLVFLGGLALNLTPCVYPMIPITITYFGGQAAGKKGNLFAHALLYVIGMAITYSILGVFAAMTGGLFGAALQYPPVLIGIALIMVLLALSMFDVYELRMPAMLNRLAGSSQKGLGGTLVMGMTVGIVAAPCIGPFVLGLLTYVGNRGNILLGFLLFFTLALGLGTPFILLGVFSGSIHRLPRSGAWMVWVRKIFGFILLAMAAYFLKNIFPDPLAYSLTFALIMLLGGIYLAWIDPVPNSGKTFSFVRNLVGVLFFAIALYSATTGLQSTLVNTQVRMEGSKVGDRIEWLPYSNGILQRASLEEKPVFIDFYADWCAACKELDNKTYSAAEVIERSSRFIMCKVDLTAAGDPRVEALRKQYEIRGMPTLIFLKPNGEEIAALRGTGFESKDAFLEKMNLALLSAANPKNPE
jgi:thiol:disulfide interchange protein DsbD